MENKYYTPAISELHVGFEYEYKSEFDNEFYKAEVEESNILKFTNTSEYRVKYLDQSDIEELGYIKEKPEWHDWWNAFYKEYEWGVIKINVKNEKRIALSITCLSKDNTSRILFSGRIKNKSELKRLLRQLKIQNEDEE